MITCDTKEWENRLDEFHPNKYLKKVYKKSLVLNKSDYGGVLPNIEEDVKLEKVTSELLNMNYLKNIDKVKEWIDDNWLNVEDFLLNGVGCCMRNESTILSWSLMDCYHSKSAEIGIFTDEDYMGRGYGSITAAATVEACFQLNFKEIGWHCIETNIGSNRIAQKLGFKEQIIYSLFSPFPPIENDTDLNASEWEKWAKHYDEVYKIEPDYCWLAVECWAKAECIDKTMEVAKEVMASSIDYKSDFLLFLLENSVFRKFKPDRKWQDFLSKIN